MDPIEQRNPAAETAALDAIHRYFTAINAGDEAAYHDSLNYPHTRLAGGGIRHWEHAPRRVGFTQGLQEATPGWHHSLLDYADPIQSSANKVHFRVRFTRYDAQGRALEVHHSFYIVTLIEGHWGIQIRSSFVPQRQV